MNQPQFLMNINIRIGLKGANIRRKVLGTHPLLKAEILSTSPQIERPNSKLTKCDSVHFCGKETTTES